MNTFNHKRRCIKKGKD